LSGSNTVFFNGVGRNMILQWLIIITISKQTVNNLGFQLAMGIK